MVLTDLIRQAGYRLGLLHPNESTTALVTSSASVPTVPLTYPPESSDPQWEPWFSLSRDLQLAISSLVNMYRLEEIPEQEQLRACVGQVYLGILNGYKGAAPPKDDGDGMTAYEKGLEIGIVARDSGLDERILYLVMKSHNPFRPSSRD